MDRAAFQDYLARFNARDVTAFQDYLCADVQILNGTLRISGIDGMTDHYVNRIWPDFEERLHLLRFVGDDRHVAVELRAEFTALGDRAQTLFGPVERGDGFVYRGLIMYDLRDERFATITVAYNSFTSLRSDGREIEMGLPH